MLTSAVAEASGGAVAPTSITAIAKLEFGLPGTSDSRGCTAVLVRPRALATSTECISSAAHPDPQASTALPVTAQFRSGLRLPIGEVVPTEAPGISLVVLPRPADVTPIGLSATAAVPGEALTVVGFGRTKSEWVPGQPHVVVSAVAQVADDRIDLTLADSTESGLCRGDAGAPVLRDLGSDNFELVALAVEAEPKGCYGATTPDTAGAIEARSAAGLASLPTVTAAAYDQRQFGPIDGNTSVAANSEYGSAVASADFNKDGFQDVVVGAPNDLSGAGSVTVYAGSATGPAAAKKLSQTGILDGDEAGDRFGAALATGDFNKDGYIDLAVGAPGEVISTIKSGAIAIFNGSATGLNTGRGIALSNVGRGNLPGSEFGAAFAVADFNQDTYADLAVGAPGRAVANINTGEITVLKGSANGVVLGWIVAHAAAGAPNGAGDRFGAALAAGNVTGPNTGTVYPDLIIGAPKDDVYGMVYVIPGSSNGPVSGGFSYNKSLNNSLNLRPGLDFGAALAVADFDKDGWADAAVGAPGNCWYGPTGDGEFCYRTGAVVVMKGASTPPTVPRPGIELPRSLGAFGTALATGEVNGDTYPDLVIGAPSDGVLVSGPASGGFVSVYTGRAASAGGPLNTATISQPTSFGFREAEDAYGAAVALGDLNKDGKADAIVGISGEFAPGRAATGVVTTHVRVAQGS